MKKTILLVLTVMMLLTGCSASGKKENEKFTVVTSIYPIYEWTKAIIGEEDVELSLLMNKGTDLHNYQASASDIIMITDSDLFIYNGGESDEWMEDILKENKSLNTLNVMASIEDYLKEEEEVEGMQEEEHNEEHHEEEGEFDEHVWLSLRNAVAACNQIKNKLVEADPAHKQAYEANCEKYIAELSKLDEEYSKAVNNSTNKVMLFADRFPFRYLVDDYGISYYAAFKGCSAESEASFETIRFLAEKTDELKLKYIMVLENSETKIAQAIINSTVNKDQQVEVLNSLQSVTLADNLAYIDVMRSNLETLKKVLN